MLIKFKSFLNGLQRLRRQFASTKRYQQLLGSVSVPGKGAGRSEWVISRPLNRFARFELKSVPKPQRTRALELQIRQWTPFTKTGWYLIWQQDDALVWAWDADRIETAILENRLKPANIPIIPETLLHQSQDQGVHLVTSLEGVEGQVWSERSLLSSRWWPRVPDVSEWLNFQRDAGTLPEHQSSEVPAPLPMHWEERPWAKSAALGQASINGAKVEMWAIPIVVLCLFAGSAWYGAQWIKLQEAISAQSAALEALNVQAGPIIEARGQALEALSRIKALQATDPYPDQLILLARVAESLPKDGTYLKEWEFQNGKLKLLITAPNKMVSSDYIKQFQSFEVFKNVQASPGSDPASLALSMEVLPLAEIKFASENNATAKKESAAVPSR